MLLSGGRETKCELPGFSGVVEVESGLIGGQVGDDMGTCATFSDSIANRYSGLTMWPPNVLPQ